MSQTINIDLPEETKAALDIVVREEGVTQDELIGKALKDYLFVRQFRTLRERVDGAGFGDLHRSGCL